MKQNLGTYDFIIDDFTKIDDTVIITIIHPPRSHNASFAHSGRPVIVPYIQTSREINWYSTSSI